MLSSLSIYDLVRDTSNDIKAITIAPAAAARDSAFTASA